MTKDPSRATGWWMFAGGMIGLVLSAPLVSAAVAITRHVAQAREAEESVAAAAQGAGPPTGQEPAPA